MTKQEFSERLMAQEDLLIPIVEREPSPFHPFTLDNFSTAFEYDDVKVRCWRVSTLPLLIKRSVDEIAIGKEGHLVPRYELFHEGDDGKLASVTAKSRLLDVVEQVVYYHDTKRLRDHVQAELVKSIPSEEPANPDVEEAETETTGEVDTALRPEGEERPE